MVGPSVPALDHGLLTNVPICLTGSLSDQDLVKLVAYIRSRPEAEHSLGAAIRDVFARPDPAD